MRPSALLPLAFALLLGCYDWTPAGGRLGSDDDDSTAADDDDATDDDDSADDDDDAVADPCTDPVDAEPLIYDEECRVDLEITADPALQIVWQVSEFDPEPCFKEVMMTPLVLPLTDDDGDGAPSAGDDRAVVFNTFCGSDYSGAGRIRALRGDGSEELWVATDPTYYVQPDSQLAAGDIDGDGWPEIVGVSSSHQLMALDRFGAGLWVASNTVPSGAERGGAFLADLDGDGTVEILYGNQIYDAAGNLLATGGHGTGSNNARPEFPTSFAVDADLDGDQEVITGNAAYDITGAALWANGQPDGFPAAGNFDADPEAEFAIVSNNTVRIQDTDGSVIAGPVSLPGSGSGGPPTVADFDGDGAPEIGVANLAFYAMLDTDLSLMWSNPTQDLSSSITGSSAFDFDADGASEVVYADELDVWVWEGGTGALIYQGTGHASGTHLEYPVVAQVIDEGPPQIVVGSNNLSYPGWNGITLLSDVGRAWVPTRGVWNQHAFMPTHIGDDLSIPGNPDMPWTVGQGFRQNEIATVPGQPAPDLQLELHAICEELCPDQLRLLVRPANPGAASDGFTVQVARADDGTVLATGVSLFGLPMATSAAPMELLVDALAAAGSDLVVTIDMADEVLECHEDNNVLLVPEPSCP